MRPPSEIAKILRVELVAEESDYEKLTGPVHGDKQFRYQVTFSDSVTFHALEHDVERIEDKENIPLKLVGIEPAIEVTDDSIEARYTVTIKETEDRKKLENHQLGTFTDES